MKNKRRKRRGCQDYGFSDFKHQDSTLATRGNTTKFLPKNSHVRSRKNDQNSSQLTYFNLNKIKHFAKKCTKSC